MPAPILGILRGIRDRFSLGSIFSSIVLAPITPFEVARLTRAGIHERHWGGCVRWRLCWFIRHPYITWHSLLNPRGDVESSSDCKPPYISFATVGCRRLAPLLPGGLSCIVETHRDHNINELKCLHCLLTMPLHPSLLGNGS